MATTVCFCNLRHGGQMSCHGHLPKPIPHHVICGGIDTGCNTQKARKNMSYECTSSMLACSFGCAYA
eukprot:2180476-Karenia_brevis.AAC.1